MCFCVSHIWSFLYIRGKLVCIYFVRVVFRVIPRSCVFFVSCILPQLFEQAAVVVLSQISTNKQRTLNHHRTQMFENARVHMVSNKACTHYDSKIRPKSASCGGSAYWANAVKTENPRHGMHQGGAWYAPGGRRVVYIV